MSHIFDEYVKADISAPSGSAAFDFTSETVPTGFQGFDASKLTTNDTTDYTAVDSSGNREVGIGTWNETSKTLARTVILSSTNSDAAESFTGTVTVAITNTAIQAESNYHASTGVIPGGRLTLTSGTPVTTSDVTGATTIYYSPYVHNKITLWNGDYWQTIEFSEASLALGTITSDNPYDVFAYLSGGALTLEILAWTDDTTRATAVTTQDGRLCKSGDKTRLLVGSFYTTSTTTTEDSEANRFLFNLYNREKKKMERVETADHTYETTTEREYGGSTTTRCSLMNGYTSPLVITGAVAVQASDECNFRPGGTDGSQGPYLRGGGAREVGAYIFNMRVGLAYTYVSEYGTTAVTFQNGYNYACWDC